jgi:hypothetical protein
MAGMAGIPQRVEPEAQDVALILDQMMADLLAEAGLARVKQTGATVKSLGLLVQWAIDRRIARLGSECGDGGRAAA